ncbi:isochorismatase family protein [Microbulbifer thermotolerans]|uniref:isochorismatase n=1 Tax=Microbulbifer thermotolerans TaxID=252514 RepID=A0A143HPL0_MICTH|nr:isochorismatase family protein [Microbulbifer thermotolerans]AMX03675.1 isochorismatase [Microbulbifer thermotolerans]MCX2780945.1 isochorismatase family protein [Microbulbifer thermotolerans]MCX2782070.1 isochorismatase family protein [Microbulbifer thermotolerans]MCX2796201.1 isochorismatase family protein [Microbulbifer thermotolerans]MCX2802541.1 isochorismatase family protein [Microbulbifer thermotolerans]
MSIPSIRSYPMPQQMPENRVRWNLDAERAVLLIHDMQEYFLHFYGEESALIDTLLANLIALRSWAWEHKVPVVYTAQPPSQTAEERALLTDLWGPGITASDPEAAKIVTPLTPEKNDTVLVKWRYSAFQRSHLEALMRDWGRDQLIIGGVYAHIGCMTTALDAFMRDIKPFLVADAVADFSPREHQQALDFVAGRCGSVTTVEEILNPVAKVDFPWLTAQITPLLEEDAGTPDPEDNLLDYGLDSIQVMQLIGRWQQLGIHLSFEELAGEPTLANWWKLIEQKQAA